MGSFYCSVPKSQSWASFCRAVGRTDLIGDTDSSVTDDLGEDDCGLYDELQKIFSMRTLQEWVALFIEHREPGGPALTSGATRTDPHVRFRGLTLDEKHPIAGDLTTSGHPIRVRGAMFATRVPAPWCR